MTVRILAFDGVLAHTLEARAEAVLAVLDAGPMASADPAAHSASRHAVDGVGATLDRAHVRALIPGRTLHEVLRLLMPTVDETTLDVCTIRAQQHATARLARGVDLASGAGAFVQRARAAAMTLVLRSDSARRDVERILSLSALDDAFTFLRCADDPPVTRAWGIADSIAGSYAAITHRLDARRVSTDDRVAFEAGEFAASIARRHVGRVEVGVLLH